MPSRGARLALALASLAGAASTPAAVIERVVAVVDEIPVLFSEVEALRLLRGLAPELALQAAVDETLMLREASRLPEAAVSPEEERLARASLEQRLDAATRDAIGLDELGHIARRQTMILKYVDLRFRPQVRLADDAVARAYREEHAGPEAPPLEAVAPEIQRRLLARALDERIEAWIGELRAGARIRLNP